MRAVKRSNARELAAETLAAIENRLGPIERIRELTNSTDDRLGSLAQLAEQVMNRAADFQVQKELIDHARWKPPVSASCCSALDARVATLAEHEQVLRHAEETVGHLERRAADAAADTRTRVDDFQSQKRTIEQALNDATRATDLLSSLDARVATLTERDQALRHAEQTVGHLERRSTEVAVRLEQAAGLRARSNMTWRASRNSCGRWIREDCDASRSTRSWSRAFKSRNRMPRP